MTVDELLADIREELDDEAQPYLWSDASLLRRINEAIVEANIRAHFLVDETTAAVCSIELTPGIAEYDLHPSIIVIERAALASRPSQALSRTSTEYIEYTHGSRWQEMSGEPSYIVRFEKNRIRVCPVPTVADTIKLRVWRSPTDDETVGLGDDLFDDAGIPAEHHPKLLHWVCHRALMKRDAEAQAMREAETHFQLFETHFGQRPTANSLQRRGMDANTPVRECFF